MDIKEKEKDKEKKELFKQGTDCYSFATVTGHGPWQSSYQSSVLSGSSPESWAQEPCSFSIINE